MEAVGRVVVEPNGSDCIVGGGGCGGAVFFEQEAVAAGIV